jgi:hypothetical protein
LLTDLAYNLYNIFHGAIMEERRNHKRLSGPAFA